MHEEHLRQVEAQLDYLAPFLAPFPPGEKLTHWQAVQVRDECLSDFKQRLIDKANLIQARFEKVQLGSPTPTPGVRVQKMDAGLSAHHLQHLGGPGEGMSIIDA